MIFSYHFSRLGPLSSIKISPTLLWIEYPRSCGRASCSVSLTMYFIGIFSLLSVACIFSFSSSVNIFNSRIIWMNVSPWYYFSTTGMSMSISHPKNILACAESVIERSTLILSLNSITWFVPSFYWESFFLGCYFSISVTFWPRRKVKKVYE